MKRIERSRWESREEGVKSIALWFETINKVDGKISGWFASDKADE